MRLVLLNAKWFGFLSEFLDFECALTEELLVCLIHQSPGLCGDVGIIGNPDKDWVVDSVGEV